MDINLELSVLPQSSNFLQSPFWARFKTISGWKSYYFKVRFNNKELYFLILVRKFFNFFSLAYSPLPNFMVIDPSDRELFLLNLSKQIKPFLPKFTLFVRWDLDWSMKGDNSAPLLMTRFFTKSRLSIQPADTTIINLSDDKQMLLATMHKKTRYNITLADKKGVTIERSGSDGVSVWYKMYQETAQRDAISIHPLEYYQNFFLVSNESGLGPQARLYLAYHEGDLLAGIITLFYNDMATYVYGASSNIKRNLMATYALQWRAICDAKEVGCLFYDFFGIPPTADVDHPMHGLYQFKVGFGGDIIHRMGAWDFSYQPVLYYIYSLIEAKRQEKRIMSKKREPK